MRETISSRVPAHPVRAPRRALVLAISAVAMLVFGSTAAASPPLQERVHFENLGILLPGATAACGFPVYGDFVGDFHFTVFYDKDGNIVREVDTFPSVKFTIYAPSTGKSYTSAGPAVLHTQYTSGAAIGSTAIAELTGLREKVGGIDLDSGRFVWEGVVIAYDPAGVPLIRLVRVISSVGPDLEAAIGRQRCAAVR